MTAEFPEFVRVAAEIRAEGASLPELATARQIHAEVRAAEKVLADLDREVYARQQEIERLVSETVGDHLTKTLDARSALRAAQARHAEAGPVLENLRARYRDASRVAHEAARRLVRTRLWAVVGDVQRSMPTTPGVPADATGRGMRLVAEANRLEHALADECFHAGCRG